MPKEIRYHVGTRGSRLALTQARLYLDTLKAKHPSLAFDLSIIQTSGDQFGQLSPEGVMVKSGKGIFVKEIEEALLEGRIDLAIHSLKDLPGDLPQGLVLAGFQKRGDPRDVLVAKSGWEELGQGARIGTSSLRRQVQLAELAAKSNKTIEMVNLRGNLDTRVKKVESGDLDGVILSGAGLNRLGLSGRVSHFFDPVSQIIPACGQGTLAAEIRSDRADLFEILSLAEDRQTRLASELERRVLKTLGGGCLEAIGIYAEPVKVSSGDQELDLGSLALHLYRQADEAGQEPLRYDLLVSAENVEAMMQRLAGLPRN
ncbi:MAG: hydroxymethylbilane synthase [Elusimicrobia bacterium]|nr:hydroxymethylbilane synthase [Elusimicrobiota bacterium]